MMHYTYTHSQTESMTGFFTCEPTPPLPLEEAIKQLSRMPLDDFLRRSILLRLHKEDPIATVKQIIAAFPGELPLPILTLLQEFGSLNANAAHALRILYPEWEKPLRVSDDAPATSLVVLQWNTLPWKKLQKQWGEIFSTNLEQHRKLPLETLHSLQPLYFFHDCQTFHDGQTPALRPPAFILPFTKHLRDAHRDYLETHVRIQPLERMPTEQVVELALERLNSAGIIAGQEMRHTASLSPIGLLCPWNLRLTVTQGTLEYTLSGTATCYGRGLTIPAARASCLMEMVERASSYVSVDGNAITHRFTPTRLTKSRRSDLQEQGFSAIDPNDFPIDVPYNDEELYWISGETILGKRVEIPVQLVTLFSNLEEISLCDAHSSTGLATGITIEEAKLAALTEILERDAAATSFFNKSDCFVLETSDPILSKLMADYAARGIRVQFQDLTNNMGFPVIKCFVIGNKGAIAQGFGAGLSMQKALLSALTETPYPYPSPQPSGPYLRNLPVRIFEDLPNYSIQNAPHDLAMLENLLATNGRPPVYVTLTHETLQFPVVRALIPGMELASDMISFAPVPPRLYQAYLEYSAKNS